MNPIHFQKQCSTSNFQHYDIVQKQHKNENRRLVQIRIKNKNKNSEKEMI